MQNARLEDSQAGIKIARRNTNNLRYADDTTLMAQSDEELKSVLMMVKVESEKAGLKFSIRKTKIMASGPITSWQIGGERVAAVTDFLFLGSKITVGGDFSHEIKRCLLLWRKAVMNIDSVLKSRDITLPTKVCISQSYGFFPIVMYGCESWTIKSCFQTVVLKKTLESPLTARRSNQSILKEINPKYSLEGLMLKLKLP